MERIVRLLFAAFLLVTVIAWAGQADSHAQLKDANATQGTATIVFYRPGAFYGKALKPSIFVDGTEIGRLKSGKYISYQTTPGKHMLASSKQDTAIEVNLAADQAQYVEMLIQSGTWRGAGRLIPVPAEEGKQKSEKLKAQEN